MKTLEDLAELLKKVEYVQNTFDDVKKDTKLTIALNKILAEHEIRERIGDRHIRDLRGIVNHNKSFSASSERFPRLNRALDLYINLYGHKDVTSNDICHYLVENTFSLDNQLFNRFKHYQYYFLIRNSYSTENCITVSVIRFHYQDDMVNYQNFRYHDTLDLYSVSQGGVFMNGLQTLAIVGMVNFVSTNTDKPKKVMENIYVNLSRNFEYENIFNGIYFGCCLKNSAYTPFATRICFVPIEHDFITNDEEQKVLARFSFSFMNTDPYDDYQLLFKEVKKTHNNITRDKEFDIFQQSIALAGLSLSDIVETRIKAEIDDKDEFGGLREFSLF